MKFSFDLNVNDAVADRISEHIEEYIFDMLGTDLVVFTEEG